MAKRRNEVYRVFEPPLSRQQTKAVYTKQPLQAVCLPAGMLTLSSGTALSLDVILTVLHGIAICLTVFRVYHRTMTRRLWWDDFVAFLALFGDVVYLSVLWFQYAGPNSILRTHKVLVIRYWLELMLFLLVIWMTRISLALAIARIFPLGEPTRHFAMGLALLSSTLCVVSIIQSAVVCSKEPALNSGPSATCQWPNSLRILVIVANIFSDTLLVATPLYKLWRIRLPRNQRRLILTIFAASAVTTSATVGCAVFQFAPEKWEPAKTIIRAKLSYVEAGISFVVCNLLVVVTYCYRVFGRGQDLELSENTLESCESCAETFSHSFTQFTLTEITDDTFTDQGCLNNSPPLSRSPSEHRTSHTQSR